MKRSEPLPFTLPVVVATLGLVACGGAAPDAQGPDAAPQSPGEAAEAPPMAEPEVAEEPSDMEPASAEAPPEASADEPEKETSLSDGETRTMSVIQKVILDNRPAFRTCYDAVQAKLPELKGDMTLYFVLDAGGRVKKAELNQERSTLKNAELTECAIGELRKLQFPASSKGLETKVNYPFNFNPR